MRIKFYLLIISIAVSVPVFSQQDMYRQQELYRTLHGDIAVSISTGDSITLVVSNEMLLLLDYESSKLSFRVPLETFRTGTDSIDRKLYAMRDTIIEFTGKLSISINTKKYDPQNYLLEGTLTCAGHSMPVKGKGSMTCLPNANRLTPACTLLFSLESNLSILNLSRIFPASKQEVRIDLRQSILEREP